MSNGGGPVVRSVLKIRVRRREPTVPRYVRCPSRRLFYSLPSPDRGNGMIGSGAGGETRWSPFGCGGLLGR